MKNSIVNKYKILEFINKLAYNDRMKAITEWHHKLGISETTFKKYLYTKTDSHYIIPSDHLIQIAHFLNVPILHLYENPPIKSNANPTKKTNHLKQVDLEDSIREIEQKKQ